MHIFVLPQCTISALHDFNDGRWPGLDDAEESLGRILGGEAVTCSVRYFKLWNGCAGH